MKHRELAIVGLGAVGGAALLAAARAGIRAVGFDRFAPPHEMGSTHGETRIVRAAIGEGASYTPLALRSFELNAQLSDETRTELVNRCGGLILGGVVPHATHAGGDFLATTIEAARRFNIDHELLSGAEVRRRFPVFASFDGETAYFEPGAGFALPEAVVRAQLDRARALGAEIRVETRVVGLRRSGEGVVVTTASDEVSVDRVVVCAGAWMSQFLPPEMAADLRTTRQTLHWFETPAGARGWEPERAPVFIWGDIYGFPEAVPGGGVKIATEDMSADFDPDDPERPVALHDVAAIEAKVRAAFPNLGARTRSTACIYTATPDGHFRVGRHPEMDQVIVASTCSGHGFKHAAAVGEALVLDPGRLASWAW